MMKLLLVLFLFVAIVAAFDTFDSSIRTYEDDLCKFRKCIPKCCPEGQNIFGFNKNCRRPRKFRNLTFSEVPLYDMDRQKTGRFLRDVLVLIPGKILDPEFNKSAFDYSPLEHNYYLTEEGFLFQEVPNNWDRWYKWNTSRFCVDYQLPMKSMNMVVPELRFFTIMGGTEPAVDDPIITWGLLISCFFLFLVLVVYSLLLELRNLSGMVLMAYVASLLGAFLVLASIQLSQHSNATCCGLTYSTYFLFLASFCWMNVMSCDIWWTFRGYAKARPIHRRGELFKFGMYCVYAFGLPAILTTGLIVLNETNMKHMPWFVTPNIPKKGCFFGDEEKLLYLYIPMLILILSNWMFYLMTAFNIWRLHRATAVLDSAAAGTPAAHRSQKYRFLVYLKLSVIMGINWVLEVVSSFQPDFKGWYVTDIYNMLIGLSIFLIFVCKIKIFRKVGKRISFLFNSLMGWRKPGNYAKSTRSSNTTESDYSQGPSVCANPKGPVYTDNDQNDTSLYTANLRTQKLQNTTEIKNGKHQQSKKEFI